MDENYVECLATYLGESGWAGATAKHYANQHARRLEEAKHKPKCTECGIWHDNQWGEQCNRCK